MTAFHYDDTYAEYLLAQLKQRAPRSDHLSLPLQQGQGNETAVRSDQEAGAMSMLLFIYTGLQKGYTEYVFSFYQTSCRHQYPPYPPEKCYL